MMKTTGAQKFTHSKIFVRSYFIVRDFSFEFVACRWLQNYGAGERITLPIAHGEGRYQVGGEELRRLEGEGCVVLRYAANPNGSVGDVAGLSNPGGNVLGLMPHPERACDPQTGGTDGLRLLAAALG